MALPPYIVNQGEFVALYSNRSWLVNGEVAKRAVEILPYPGTKGTDPAFYIWFGRCKEKKAQTLRFRRDIVLPPGRPKDINLLLRKSDYDTAN